MFLLYQLLMFIMVLTCINAARALLTLLYEWLNNFQMGGPIAPIFSMGNR